MERDRGDIVLGWLTRVAIVLGALGVAGFDLVSVLSTQVQVTDQANYAARAASESWNSTPDIQRAYDAAALEAHERSPANTLPVEGFAIDPDGTAHLQLQRTATTLVLRRIGPVADWAQVSAAGTGRFVD